jgi:hypothetical protein
VSGVWLWLPVAGPIRTSTVVAAVVMVLVIWWRRRDPWPAIVAVAAWTSMFETLYHLVGIVGFQWPMANFVWQTAAVGGWVILAGVLGIWPDWRPSALFALVMGAWVVAGFHANVASQTSPISLRDEILNEGAKSLLALAYLAGAVRVRGAVKPRQPASVIAESPP